MKQSKYLASLIVLAVAWPALAVEPELALMNARVRNQGLADQAKPGERAAILAVTTVGANVILDDSGSVASVQLEGCVFHNSVLAVLHDLPRLKQLQLGHSKVTDAGLEHLRGLDTVESLTLIQTNIGDQGLVH